MDLVLSGTFRHLDLFRARPLEAQVEAVVSKRADLHVVAVVAHANNGDLRIFDQTDQLLQASDKREIEIGLQSLFV